MSAVSQQAPKGPLSRIDCKVLKAALHGLLKGHSLEDVEAYCADVRTKLSAHRKRTKAKSRKAHKEAREKL
ncbi:hypothetical protein D9M70_361810 [compost metagenome]